MVRQFERSLLLIVSLWQMMDGAFTIFYFGIYRSYIYGKEQLSVFPGYFTLTVGLGVLFIGCSIVNLYLRSKCVKDNQIAGRYIWILIIQSILSFIVADLLSLVLLVAVTVIALAKNKAIRVNIITD